MSAGEQRARHVLCTMPFVSRALSLRANLAAAPKDCVTNYRLDMEFIRENSGSCQALQVLSCRFLRSRRALQHRSASRQGENVHVIFLFRRSRMRFSCLFCGELFFALVGKIIPTLLCGQHPPPPLRLPPPPPPQENPNASHPTHVFQLLAHIIAQSAGPGVW